MRENSTHETEKVPAAAPLLFGLLTVYEWLLPRPQPPVPG